MTQADFTQKAPGIMAKLMKDFALTPEDAAAILGNIGHETGGFSYMQEIAPMAGKGGFGWCQWTGSRRVAFESYCARNDLDPRSDKANYAWLFLELSGDYKATVPAVKLAPDLDAKVVAFERWFEKAGVPAYASRQKWARLALSAFNTRINPPASPVQPDPAFPKEPTAENGQRGSTGLQNGLAGLLMAGLAAGVVFLIRRFG